MTSERGVQKSRATQVGLLMRSYRESYTREDGRRGLTQDELLRLMADVAGEYGERSSHATVSRWESGATRPSLERLKTFGTALHLPETEIAGLILLAGLAVDFDSARERADSKNGHANGNGNGNGSSDHGLIDWDPPVDESADDGSERDVSTGVHLPSLILESARFLFVRTLLVAAAIVGLGFAFSWLGWDNMWMPTGYVVLAIGLVVTQGFLIADVKAGLREFYWVSVFVVLTTPLLQFGALGMDHYGFYRLGNFAGPHTPFMLALVMNVALSGTAGLLFNLLWHWQNNSDREGRSFHSRAAWVAVPPLAGAYLVIIVLSNASIWLQLGILMPVLAAQFTALLILRDPTLNPTENERRFAQNCTLSIVIMGTVIGAAIVMTVYLLPDLPMVLPDHNLIQSWEIDFDSLGYSRAEALEKLNIGYVWHAMLLYVYMLFVIGGNFMVAIYRMGRRAPPPWVVGPEQVAELPAQTGGVRTGR